MLQAFESTWDWGKVGAIGAAGVALVGLVLVWIQIAAGKRALQAQSMLTLMLELQTETSVRARKRLYQLHDDQSDLEDYMQARDDIEPCLRTLETVGVLAFERLLPVPMLLESWGPMIARCWEYSENFTNRRRDDEHRPDLWRSFEYIAALATKEASASWWRRSRRWWIRLGRSVGRAGV